MNIFVLAQFFGILVIISNVLAMQMKRKKNILMFFIFANLFSAINFILLKSYSGTLICIFSIAQTIINYLYDKKEKEVPKILIGVYIVISIVCGIFTYNQIFDLLPIICSILYTVTILQQKESNIRKITLINITLWIIYDLLCKAYTAGISDFITSVSTVIAIYRYDYKSKIKEQNNEN